LSSSEEEEDFGDLSPFDPDSTTFLLDLLIEVDLDVFLAELEAEVGDEEEPEVSLSVWLTLSLDALFFGGGEGSDEEDSGSGFFLSFLDEDLFGFSSEDDTSDEVDEDEDSTFLFDLDGFGDDLGDGFLLFFDDGFLFALLSPPLPVDLSFFDFVSFKCNSASLNSFLMFIFVFPSYSFIELCPNRSLIITQVILSVDPIEKNSKKKRNCQQSGWVAKI